MGLLNNNNYRRNKRANLRKQNASGTNTNSGNVNGSGPSGMNTGGGGGFTLPFEDLGLGDGGGSGNMMGYMQLAAAATPMVTGFLQGRKQKKLAEGLDKDILAQDKVVSDLMANRQEIRNPYANLSVATEAAEFQGQQTDQALANSLDAMQAGGFGAGGATALARAAAKSKQGISADIQKQEATNQKFFAQGEQTRQNMQENRDIDNINFEIGNLDNMEQQRMDALSAQQASNAAGVGGSLDAVGSIMKNPEAMSAITGLFGG